MNKQKITTEKDVNKITNEILSAITIKIDTEEYEEALSLIDKTLTLLSEQDKNFKSTDEIISRLTAFRANCFKAMGKFEKALKEIDKSIKLFKFHGYYSDKASILEGMGLFEKAIKEISEAITMKPEIVLHLNNRAYYYYQLKKYRKAKSDIMKAIKLDPSFDSEPITAATAIEIFDALKDEKNFYKYLPSALKYYQDIEVLKNEPFMKKYLDSDRFIKVANDYFESNTNN